MIMSDKKTEKLVKVSPVKDYPAHPEKGVKLWGIQFNVVNGKLVAEIEKSLVASLIEAEHVKAL